MLVLHYQVYGEERFPKLFSYEKLFIRFAKYQIANRHIARKAKVLRCPNFALVLDFLSVTV